MTTDMVSKNARSMGFDEETTLEEASVWIDWARNKKEGAVCPCCAIPQKMEHTPLDAGMAKALRIMCAFSRRTGSRTVALKAMWRAYKIEQGKAQGTKLKKAIGGKWAKLRHWGLIEPVGGTSKGVWHILDKGFQFSRGQILLPGHAFICLNVCFGLDETTMVTIWEALGKYFDPEKPHKSVPEHVLSKIISAREKQRKKRKPKDLQEK